MLTGELKWGALSAADAFVLPSHQENFGIAVAEALACATPVLISNKINIWREIEGDGAGFVENDDLAGTLNLLKRWLAAPEASRAEMRANAPKCFAARFEIERATDSLLAVIANPSRA
jgi:glycosyltransferase involved in cell wall biosynthesis